MIAEGALKCVKDLNFEWIRTARTLVGLLINKTAR